MWLVAAVLGEVVEPSPHFHVHLLSRPPGNGSVDVLALNDALCPCTIEAGLMIIAVGDIGLKAVIPFGVPTPETPSKPGLA